MNLLLIYPKPAETPKTRLSRADAQLNGIAYAARSAIAELVSHNDSLQLNEVGVTSTAHLRPGRAAGGTALHSEEMHDMLAASDMVVDVSHSPTTHLDSFQYNGALVHLCPAFAGSFACNDVMIHAGGHLQQQDIVKTIKASRAPFESEKPLVHELDASMHYAAFTPLPVRVGDAFYRSDREHALVFLSYAQNELDRATIESDKQVLADILYQAENLKTVTFVCETLNDVPMVTSVADALSEALGIKPTIWGLRKGEFHDMFSVIAKTDVVLFGGNSLYADAIIRGKPVYTWRTRQAGTDTINDAYKAYTHHRNREKLVVEQRTGLEALFQAQYQDATLPNHRLCFDTVLLDLIYEQLPQVQKLETINTAGKPTHIIQDARLAPRKSLSESISRSIWSKRHKIAQFRTGLARKAEGAGELKAGGERVFVRR